MSERQSGPFKRTINNPYSYTLPVEANGQSKELSNKVVLIIGLASERSCRLAVTLAHMGADIAIIYFSDAYHAATRVCEEVKALGRRCLIITHNTSGDNPAHELVQQIITVFGRLDVFISYPMQTNIDQSLLTREMVANGAGAVSPRHLYRSLLLPNLSIIKAALHEQIAE